MKLIPVEKPIVVQLIGRKKQVAIVEITEDSIPKRIVVSANKLIEDNSDQIKILQSDLDMGIEYGVPLSDLLKDRVISAQQVSDELHKNGIWTAEEIYSNPKVVQSAILSAAKPLLADVMQIAKSFSRKEL